MADDDTARLHRLDTCAVSDALDQLGIPARVATEIRAVTGPARVAGRVITVELGPVTSTPPPRHLCTAAIEAGGSGDVLVIAHQGRRDCAGWGGNLSRAAQARGIGVTPRTARGRTQEIRWREPIDFAGVTVASDDYVIADSTGVVFIPSVDVDRVLDAAEAIAAREAAMVTAIAKGVPVSEVMGVGYETLLNGDRP